MIPVNGTAMPDSAGAQALAPEELLPLVYDELRRMAGYRMAMEAPGHTLQPTALVHEAWLRLVGGSGVQFDDRGQFFAAAAEAMRRILVDRARRKQARRRGEGAEHVELDGLQLAGPVDDEQLLALNDALERFAALDAPKAELVKLRYFVGLTTEQAAKVMNISEPTAKRWWAYAKAWLFRECQDRTN